MQDLKFLIGPWKLCHGNDLYYSRFVSKGGDIVASSSFDLTGKVALVTGGNRGIGLGMAEALAEAGADVCIWGRNEEKNRAAKEKLGSYGRKILALRCDVSDEQQVKESFSEMIKVMGRLDSCFANAGIRGQRTSFHKMTIEEWRGIFSVNMDGVFFTLRGAIRQMLGQGDGGSLVVTSSLGSVQGIARGEHYSASKAGVSAIIRGLAVEYARFGIRANSILPGWIETDMTTETFSSDRFQERVLRRIPQRRWGRPADFGPIAVYFASDASAYHSGDTVIIDGAYVCF